MPTKVRDAKSTSKRTFSLTPAQFRYRWVKALESGKYRQGQKVLHQVINSAEGKIEEFCCLGVACDLYRKYGGRLDTHKISGIDGIEIAYGRREDEETAALPEVVRVALGLRGSSGDFDDGTSLAFLNDTGKSFDEIAAIIRSKPEDLLLMP